MYADNLRKKAQQTKSRQLSCSQGFFKVWFEGTPKNFEATFFSKMFKIIPKRTTVLNISLNVFQ